MASLESTQSHMVMVTGLAAVPPLDPALLLGPVPHAARAVKAAPEPATAMNVRLVTDRRRGLCDAVGFIFLLWKIQQDTPLERALTT